VDDASMHPLGPNAHDKDSPPSSAEPGPRFNGRYALVTTGALTATTESVPTTAGLVDPVLLAGDVSDCPSEIGERRRCGCVSRFV